jgi:hypothetical protein
VSPPSQKGHRPPRVFLTVDAPTFWAKKSLVLKPRSFFTERYSINAGEASIVLLASRTPKKIFFSIRASSGGFFHQMKRPIGKNGLPETFFARSRAVFFRTKKKKHAAVDVLSEKEGSLSCGRTAPSNKKTSTMFLSKRHCFFVIFLAPTKKTYVFF